jgi:hypothetical protein
LNIEYEGKHSNGAKTRGRESKRGGWEEYDLRWPREYELDTRDGSKIGRGTNEDLKNCYKNKEAESIGKLLF